MILDLIYEEQDLLLVGHRDGFVSRVSIAALADSFGAADRIGEAVKLAMGAVINRPVRDAGGHALGTASAFKDGADVLDHTPDRTRYRRIIDYKLRWTP